MQETSTNLGLHVITQLSRRGLRWEEENVAAVVVHFIRSCNYPCFYQQGEGEFIRGAKAL